MNILLTGGAGYIGSHTAVALSQAGHEVVILDNFCNSRKNVLLGLQKILGKTLIFIEGDVCDTNLVANTLQKYKIEVVIHFSGLKAVGESVKEPIKYYVNNVQGTISLLVAMKCSNVKVLIFSSSATVYGNPQYLPIDECHPTRATNAYGRTKLHIEEILRDVALSSRDWKIICLRYFNPVGAHNSGLIGEDPRGTPNNLVPYIAKVASGELPHLNIFGNDYDTRDGTGERDYIHVEDLSLGHLAALSHVESIEGFLALNLGTGRGYTVLEIIKTFEMVSGKKIRYELGNRRSGDIASCYAKVDLAYKMLGWKALKSIEEMCASAWRWESLNK